MNESECQPLQPDRPPEPTNRETAGLPIQGVAGSSDPLKQQLAVLQALSESPFHQHFLERFLNKAGRCLGLPWWAVHALLYVLTVAVFIGLGHVQTQFPHGGYLSLSGAVTEFIATTYLLWYVRRSRIEAFLVAARMTSPRERLVWLRRYWGPLHWGWIIPLVPPNRSASSSPGGFRRLLTGLFGPVIRIRSGVAAFLLLGLFYTSLWLGWHPGPYGEPALRFPHELCVYTDFAKAVAVLIILANFWMLHGLMRIAWGHCSTALTPHQRMALLRHGQRSVLQISCVAGLAVGGWLFTYGLDHGFTHWSWWWSFWLGVLFLTNLAILGNRSRRPFDRFAFVPRLVGAVRAAFGLVQGFYRPAEQFVVLASIVVCPGALNLLGAYASVI